MNLDNLKIQLHAIFENCGLKHEKEIEEGTVGSTPNRVSGAANGTTPFATKNEETIPTQQNNEKEFTAPDGIIYKVNLDPSSNIITVKDIQGNQKDSFKQEDKDKDGPLTKEIRNAIVVFLSPQQSQNNIVQPSTPVVPSEPTTPKVEPEAIVEVADDVAKKFKDQYGDDWKKIYYATANAQGRDPETFKK